MKAPYWKCDAARHASRRWISGFAAALLAALPIPTSAATVDLCLSVDFSDPEPGSCCPACPSSEWLTVSITDDAIRGQVSMTISAANLMNEEHVMYLYLNLDPELDATGLQFTDPTQTGSFALPTIELGTNAYKAANDGYFDIRFAFNTAAVQGFGTGKSVSYLVSIDGGSLTAPDFFHWSFPGGEPDAGGPFLAASHVLSTGPEGEQSSWIGAIPEHSILALCTIGIMTLLRRRRG